MYIYMYIYIYVCIKSLKPVLIINHYLPLLTTRINHYLIVHKNMWHIQPLLIIDR